jgi:hypothetical protein
LRINNAASQVVALLAVAVFGLIAGAFVSVETALPHCRVLFLQTIKYLFGQNTRAAHNSSSNRVSQFRHHTDLPFFLLFQECLPKE